MIFAWDRSIWARRVLLEMSLGLSCMALGYGISGGDGWTVVVRVWVS